MRKNTKVFEGAPCKKCTRTTRYASSYDCVYCSSLRAKEASKIKLSQPHKCAAPWCVETITIKAIYCPAHLRVKYEIRVATPKYRLEYTLIGIRHRAKKYGVEFSITIEDLTPIPTHCPVLGIELDYKIKDNARPSPNSPSIDRVNPKLGYVAGNVRVVSYRANALKNNATAAELRLIADDAAHLENSNKLDYYI